jgi:hypothetical protein
MLFFTTSQNARQKKAILRHWLFQAGVINTQLVNQTISPSKDLIMAFDQPRMTPRFMSVHIPAISY